MNVVFKVKERQYVIGLRQAKRILNNIYDGAEQLYIDGKKILIDHRDRHDIMNQLHGKIYV